MKPIKHKYCLGVRGIMNFKCSRCNSQETHTNYANGIKVCRNCCKETNTCQICGEKIIDNKSKRVYLGGTCNDSTWREDLIKLLKIDYFNPVVKDWSPECMSNEIRERETCDYCLYVITPKMTGVYSIAEVVDDSNKRPEKTIFCCLTDDEDKSFTLGQIKSLMQVASMISNNGAKVFHNLKEVADFLNS